MCGSRTIRRLPSHGATKCSKHSKQRPGKLRATWVFRLVKLGFPFYLFQSLPRVACLDMGSSYMRGAKAVSKSLVCQRAKLVTDRLSGGCCQVYGERAHQWRHLGFKKPLKMVGKIRHRIKANFFYEYTLNRPLYFLVLCRAQMTKLQVFVVVQNLFQIQEGGAKI